MALKDDLTSEVDTIFKTAWEERDGQIVPEASSLKLSNDAIKLNGTVLYADLSDSTRMVEAKTNQLSAEVYKAFLHCAAKLIKAHGGVITAYDGDRVMAVYIGRTKNTDAVKTALKLKWVRQNIIQPALNDQYPVSTFTVKHVVGIDTSSLFVARTGVRGSNDLVWVGRAANWAAKLCGLPDDHATWITKSVYDSMLDEGRTSTDGRPMWEERLWTSMDNATIYRSNWGWVL